MSWVVWAQQNLEFMWGQKHCRVAGCMGVTTGAGVDEVGAQRRAVGGWNGEGSESRADTGASVLGDWENRLLSGFPSIPYWALKINYQVEE